MDSVDGHRAEILSFADKLEGFVHRIKQPLGIKRLQVDDFESLRASHTQLGLEVMDRRGLHRNIELLRTKEAVSQPAAILTANANNQIEEKIYVTATHPEEFKCIVPALQQLSERRLRPSLGVLVDRLEHLESA